MGVQQSRKGTLILNANVSVLAAQTTEQNQGKNNAPGPKRAANAKKAARGLPTIGSAGRLPLTELALLGLVALRLRSPLGVVTTSFAQQSGVRPAIASHTPLFIF